MPLLGPLDSFFDTEWQRFQAGLRGLDPTAHVSSLPRTGVGVRIPAWDDVIHITPNVEVSRDQWRVFYRAQRLGETPDLPADVLASCQRRVRLREAMRNAAQPEYMRAFGQIMTALDNIQDLIATLAALGRLGIWAAPRIGGRFVPVVGWILLASDVLNLMGFFGAAAMPLYALLCQGPSAAIAAGAPGALLKNTLKREAWTLASINPFSRTARSARRLRSLGRLPGFSNFLEAAQVSDNFFGYGLQLGGLYAMMVDALYALAGYGPSAGATGLPLGAMQSAGRFYLEKASRQDAAEAYLVRQSARAVHGAALVLPIAHLLEESEVHAALAAALAGWGVLARFLEGADHDSWLAEYASVPWPAPSYENALTREVAGNLAPESLEAPAWPIPGAPAFARADDVLMIQSRRQVRALRKVLLPNRQTLGGCFTAACITQGTEQLWHGLARDAEALRFQHAPDWKMLLSCLEEGYLVHPRNSDEKVMQLWRAGKQRIRRAGDRQLSGPELEQLAGELGVELFKLLPPDAPFPPEWWNFLEAHRGELGSSS